MKSYTLDTDIGTDVDDAFALVYLLQSGVDIKAVCVSKYKTRTRAKIARKIERIVGKETLIVPGPRQNMRKYWTGIEEKALAQEELNEPIADHGFPIYDKDSVIICIGPLTNIAYQIKHNPSIKNVKKLYVMGSCEKSHNFKADKKAKDLVFQQPWDIYMITKEESDKIAFTKEELEQFKGTKLGDFLYDSAIKWLDYSEKDRSRMYDALAVSAGLGEPYVQFKKLKNNRFISCRVDTQLKDKIIESVLGSKVKGGINK
jgi:inosine-uridine nucleoside N-ribohydrolase